MGCPGLFRVLTAVSLLLAAENLYAESIAANSLKQLALATPVCAESADFIVCADPQPSGLLGTPKIFLNMIQEWNILRPDFVVCAGDMIMGGPPAELGAMWAEFEGAVGKLQVPFFPAAGNHDVSDDPEATRIYEEHAGPFNYTVTRGNLMCVMLNSEEPGDPDGTTPAQREWLRGVLKSSTAKHIFLFIHVPLFVGNWARDWQPVADILKDYPVRAVFAGHTHVYGDFGVRDGIHYFIGGSSGGGLEQREDEGAFFCYMTVKVRGDEVSYALLRPGAVFATDVITPEKVARLRALRGMLACEPVTLPMDAPLRQEVVTTLTNPFPTPLAGALRWKIPAGWQVEPGEVAFKAAPGEKVTFTTKMATGGPARFPVPVLEGMVDNPESGKPLALSQPVDLIATVQAPHAAGPVVLDGDLSEWAKAQAMPLHYDFGDKDPADLKASTRVMWDEQHLYVAVEVEDNEFHQPFDGDIVWMADSVELWIENSNWSFSLTPKGPQVFLDERPDKHLDAVVPEVPVFVKRNGNKVVYEVAYPASEVPHIRLEANNTIEFSLLVNDVDPGGPLDKRHCAELTPGAGQHFMGPKVRITLSGEK